MRFDAANACCHVLTFKEGLLSRVAHDLKLRAGRFSLVIDDARVSVDVDATSLKVVCARKDGVDAPKTLGFLERSQIERNVKSDVLHSRRFPAIRYVGQVTERSDARGRAEGQLTLHGVTRPVVAEAHRDGDRWRAAFDLHQPDFGITPYSAMLGALRIKPRVQVVFDWPAAR
ncbi:MAG: YceI family protein [Myxococcota bacterium]